MNAEIMHLDLPEHVAAPESRGARHANLAMLNDVRVHLDIRLGTRELSVRELMDLDAGSVLDLDRALQDDVEVLLNGQVVARGQIVAVDDRFGVRITAVQPEA
jgi:flagellar motor switch protein FliN/FliY